MTNIRCSVCFHNCELAEGAFGFCRARENEGGRSVSLSYGKLVSLALDPVEKKPLARFCQGSLVLSVGTFGCNMDCAFCQNSGISKAGDGEIPSRFMPPEELAENALALKSAGNIGVAFTYNEPMVGFEYVRDAAKAVRALGMKNVVVTNGSVSLETLNEVLPWIDAFNIDLKCFSAGGYHALGGDFESVKNFIKRAAESAHVEVTTLVVPEFNDSAEEIASLSAWLASVNRAIPLHLTRFFPRRNMTDRNPTDVALLRSLAEAARLHLDDVIIGNV